MRFSAGIFVSLACGVVAGTGSFHAASAQRSDFHAIVEPDGKVVLCVVKGEIVFPDRCAGTGRLTIVQPIRESPVTWRFAVGTVTVENEVTNPDCALSHAKWDSTSEREVASGKEIEFVDPVDVLSRTNQPHTGMDNLAEADITAFALDLNNDGKREIVFVASNVQRLSELNDNTDKPFPYLVTGGILREGVPYPTTFYHEQGETLGGTDAIGHVELKGVVPLSFRVGEIALLVKHGSGLTGDQMLVRHGVGRAQRIETFEFICN